MSATQSLTFGNIGSSVYGMPAVTQRKSTAGNRSPHRRKSASDEAFLIERSSPFSVISKDGPRKRSPRRWA